MCSCVLFDKIPEKCEDIDTRHVHARDAYAPTPARPAHAPRGTCSMWDNLEDESFWIVADQSEFVGLMGWMRGLFGEQVARKAVTSRFVARV